MIIRKIEKILIEHLAKWRCVALLGPRQVGKSHLLKRIINTLGGELISFDDPLVRHEAMKDPVRYLKNRYVKGRYLFIDEAARVPEIFSAVKLLVDEQDPNPTGICLANSGNYLLMRRIKESLAGRVNLFKVLPFSWQEMSDSGQLPGLLKLLNGSQAKIDVFPLSNVEVSRQREERILWGGFPSPCTALKGSDRQVWSRDYVRTYILPMVIEQFAIREAGAFERASELLFAQSARFFNASGLSQQIGVSQPTASHYAHQLEAMMVIQFLNVYFRNSIKRLIKQPKLFAVDPILLHGPLGTDFSLQAALDRNQLGSVYETFMISEIEKTLINHDVIGDLLTYRTQDQSEVDLVLSSQGRLIPFEIKWTQKPSRRDGSGLNSFLTSTPEAEMGYIVYPGEECIRISEKITAVPDWWLLGAGKR
ncbi:MAG: ATP-binding protein [Candidatus Wallbacteria bacterium]|nr:ATP-binding protein [Candidatus Wallbacteria bacterium]